LLFTPKPWRFSTNLYICNTYSAPSVDLYVGTRQTDPANSALWDDNIHFGPEGYQLFAKLIAESWAKWTTERAAVN
jgi:lysophospholipase L1-like esterase